MSRVVTLASIGALGACVLVSYGYLARQSDNSEYWGPLKGSLLVYWAISALMTAISFLYLSSYWLLIADRDTTTVYSRALKDTYSILLPVYLVFLISAALWVGVTVYAKRTGSTMASRGVTVLLWATAASSMTMLVLMAGTRESTEGWKQPLAVMAAAFVSFHHLIFDAILWREGWNY